MTEQASMIGRRCRLGRPASTLSIYSNSGKASGDSGAQLTSGFSMELGAWVRWRFTCPGRRYAHWLTFAAGISLPVHVIPPLTWSLGRLSLWYATIILISIPTRVDPRTKKKARKLSSYEVWACLDGDLKVGSLPRLGCSSSLQPSGPLLKAQARCRQASIWVRSNFKAKAWNNNRSNLSYYQVRHDVTFVTKLS